MKITCDQIRHMLQEHVVQDFSLLDAFLAKKKHEVSPECSKHTRCCCCSARTNARCFRAALENIRLEEIPYLLDTICWQVRMLDGTLDLQELSLYYKYVKRAYAQL